MNHKDTPVKQEQERVSLGKQRTQRKQYYFILSQFGTRNQMPEGYGLTAHNYDDTPPVGADLCVCPIKYQGPLDEKGRNCVFARIAIRCKLARRILEKTFTEVLFSDGINRIYRIKRTLTAIGL